MATTTTYGVFAPGYGCVLAGEPTPEAAAAAYAQCEARFPGGTVKPMCPQPEHDRDQAADDCEDCRADAKRRAA